MEIIEGMVIRKIPKEKVSHWLSSDKVVESHKKRGGETYINERGREVMVERKQLSFGGKFLVTFAFNQDSQVHFNLKTCGVGDTIESAYQNYLDKNK